MVKTGDTVANEVIFTRTVRKGTVLLLEGDKDEVFFRRFVQEKNISVIPAWGKANALEAIAILNAKGEKGILAIVDADFENIGGTASNRPNVIITDEHDVEMMIIKTDAFAAVLREYGSKKKVEAFANGTPEGIREEILRKATVIGHLRKLSISRQLNLRFEGIRYERFVDRNTLNVDIENLVAIVLDGSRGAERDGGALYRELVETMSSTNYDPYQLCCGHDFTAIFGLGLKKVLATRSKEIADPENVESFLRLAYDFESLRDTRLYCTAVWWSHNNPGYPVFR